MKKLGLFAFILGLVIAFAVPALAFTIEGAKGEKMYIGGIVMTDFGYQYRSKELLAFTQGGNGSGISDRTEFFSQVPLHSTLTGTVEAGPVGFLWEFGMGANSNPSEILGKNTSYIDTRLLYGWYNFGNCQIQAGKNTAHIYTLVPWQTMGIWNLHAYGFGFGAFYDGMTAQVRFTQMVSKQFVWQISLVDPTQFADAAASPTNKNSYTYLPMIAAKLTMNFGPIALFPAFAYQYVKWDNVASGFDDNMTAWYGLLPVIIQLGGFTGTIQGGYGQNISALSGLENFFATYQRVNGSIKNATSLNGFVDLAYTFGPVTPHIYFGYNKAKNSDYYIVGDDNNTRMMYGASINWHVNGPFYIIPEFTYYDWGKIPGVASKPDIGKEWIGGVEFRFVF